uniref:Uncharacterized protein n=1 Tax=Quercus lobata TaxID=97700 RepID=A0A7N2LHG8_QUELO
MYNANFDVLIFSSTGLVIQDYCGNVIAALSQNILQPHSVDLVEALVASKIMLFKSVALDMYKGTATSLLEEQFYLQILMYG